MIFKLPRPKTDHAHTNQLIGGIMPYKTKRNQVMTLML